MPLPRCPRCRSALITIMFGLYPLVFCSSCGARWTQAGNQQRTIEQVQEPALFASARYPVA
jgi:Zn-finger nucleic acid-binding protein